MSKARNLSKVVVDSTGDIDPASLGNVTVTPTAVSDQENTSTGAFDVPSGTSAERPASPTPGMIRYNSTIGKNEAYDSDGWTAIAVAPTISSVSPTNFNGEQGTSFTINGTYFDSSALVYFITNNGVTHAAGATTRISSTQLTATTPIDFTVAQEPLSVKVVNGSNLNATYPAAIDCGGVPVWTTASGSLGTTIETTSISYSVAATDPDSGATISYSLVSGALPPGASLNSSTGAITGTAASTASSTTYTFTLAASDNAGNTTQRSFSITIDPTTVTWNTASGSLGSDYTQRSSSFNTSASTNLGSITYSVVSGSIPTGQTLNTSTGTISGTASGVADYSSTTFNFTLRATNSLGRFSDRAFSILIASRYVGYSCSTAGENGTCSDTAPGSYIFNRVDFSSWGTPNGSCGAFTYGGCNSGSSNNYNPTPTKSYSVGANNSVWGDPCGGTPKRMYIQMSYGPF